VKNSSIAIIGMHCVYPGAHSPGELWENVLAGRRYFRIAPDERLPVEYYYDPDPAAPGKTYCNKMAVITNWKFDPTEWKIPPVTVHASDIVHWLALSTARGALQDSTIDLSTFDKTRIGVLIGNSGAGEFFRSHTMRNRWPFVERAVRRAVEKTYPGKQADALVEAIRHYYDTPLPAITEDHLAGNMGNVIAGRVANYFDFGAGAYLVDGACASSLLAVTSACNHLSAGDMDVALAGGVDVSLDPFEIIGFAKTQALAKDDIRPFDERANGMQTGEGCGIVVLAREEFARKAGLPIRAVIKGWGVSSDGSGGITQPKVDGQMLALKRAYERAGYPLSTVGYVEGHGTATAVGDRVEITALKRTLDEAGGNGAVCKVGSIKANIGHTKAAAGVAGMIKAVLALQHKIIPPHVNCATPSPAFGRPLSNLRPSTRGGSWESTGPRRTAVSAFGFGGVNTHITLEEADPVGRASERELAILGTQQTSEVILLSGNSYRELKSRVKKLIPIAKRICQAEMTDLAAALAKQEHAGVFRLAVVSSSPWQLVEQLNIAAGKLAEGTSLSEISGSVPDLFAGETVKNPRMVALFPGQGTHRFNMAEHFIRRYPFVREMCQSFETKMFELTGQSFKSKIFRDLEGADEQTRQKWQAELRETNFQQPAIVSCSMGALAVLRFLGLDPHYAVGHSLGEISALAAGRALEPLSVLHIAALRARAMSEAAGTGTGGMGAVGASADEVMALLDKHAISLSVSNFNSPRQTVVSGLSHAVDEFLDICAQKGVWAKRLPVSHAFHSALVAPAAESFRKTLDTITFSPLSGASVYSTVTGDRLGADQDLRKLLAGQIAQPVRFIEAVNNIAAQKPDLWVEVGPGSVLSGLVRDILGADAVETFPTDLDHEDDFHLLNRLVSKAFVIGLPLRTERIFEHRFHRAFDPETYNPELIVNPCERPVEPLETSLQLVTTGFPAALLPTEASLEGFGDYLDRRADFISGMISLDYRHHAGAAGQDRKLPVSPTDTPAGKEVNAASAAAATGSVTDMAIDWIAKRTGFPREFISPGKKLRDDLNLDSIKAGELALYLSKQLGRQLPLDLGIVANASIQQIADIIATNEGPAAPVEGAQLERWMRSFGIDLLPAPLDKEVKLPLLPAGTIHIFGEAGSERVKTTAARFSEAGYATKSVDPKTVTPEQVFTDAPSSLVIIFPEERRAFFELDPAEFSLRADRNASFLFQMLQSAFSADVLARKDFRIIGIRLSDSGADTGSDLDGFGGMLKTLQLELHKDHGIAAKWLVMPSAWDAGRFAEVALAEFETSGERIEYHYDPQGLRRSPTAVSLSPPEKKAPRLGGTDTLLVSGGGKGITFEMACHLAEKTGIKLALMGSSPAPAENDNENELARNLARLKGHGIRHMYVQADVTDHSAVLDAVKLVERKLGRVTAILHGAGISRFAEFLKMDEQNYLKCFRIKTTGLYNLLTSVPLKQLKHLHVISSVLGRTGMMRQADYALSNAWLDGAVKAVLAKRPELHGFSIGYSAWEETGIATKSGSLQMLRNIGTTAVKTAEGTAAYLDLVLGARKYSTYVCLGRLADELEAKLMPTIKLPKGRFLEKMLRFVPGVDLAVEAELTHEKDLYIPEHVFSGTPLMPTVMALEGMVQAAMACIGTNELPVIRDISLKRPLIVPKESGAVVRTLVLVDAPTKDKLVVARAAMCSDSDGFTNNHFELQCVFGLPHKTDDIPACPTLPGTSHPKGPEEYSPSPLFQGTFLRRITKIYDIKEADETLTEITAPAGAEYYGDGFDQTTRMPSPAVRDSMLQAGALMMPPGYLPESFEEVRVLRPLRDGEKLVCRVKARERSGSGFVADIYLYDEAGAPVEALKGFVAQAPSTEVKLSGKMRTKTVELLLLMNSLKSALNGTRLSLAAVPHHEVEAGRAHPDISSEERRTLLENSAAPRHASRLAGALAAKRATIQFLADHLNTRAETTQFGLSHEENGKPVLVWNNGNSPLPEKLEVSLADGSGLSAALVGDQPVGIDIERVEPRTTEAWRGLLGPDGYRLALELQQTTGEHFESGATRVWTLIEAGKKANSLARIVPEYERIVDDTWVVFKSPGEVAHRSISALFAMGGERIVISLSAKNIYPKE